MQNVTSMSRFVSLLVVTLVVMAVSPCFSGEKEFRGQGRKTIEKLKKTDSEMAKFFNSAYGYAVFPTVGKGAIGVGGAHGKGLVIVNDKAIGKTSLSQITVGLSLGGQKYSQFIFFKDDVALGHFQRGNYEMGAQASAVAVTAGASADADYDKGVAVFTNVGGGLMADASVGGQKFTYEAF